MPELFLIDCNNSLTPLSQSPYDSEDLLQQLLGDHPALLGGDQMGGGVERQWLFVTREAPVPDSEDGTGRWSLDHLFLDQDAIPTFVEVKRASDTRIRREVVGQMLDYAANGLRYWPVEQIQAFLASRVGDVDAALIDAFGEAVDSAEYWQRLRENISDGRVRLLFVADKIPNELLAVVEFLNRQMDHTEVLAVEIPQFTGEGLRTLAPRVLGQTQEAVQRKSSTSKSRKWDEMTFFEQLASKCSADEVSAIRKYYNWIQEQGWRIVFGRGAVDGSFWGKFKVAGQDYLYPAVCYSNGTFQFNLRAMPAPFDSEEQRRELVRRFNLAAGFDLSPDTESPGNGYPWRSVDPLADDSGFSAFTETILWYKAQAEKPLATGTE